MVYNKIYAQIGEERHIVLDPINYQYDIKQILVLTGETVPDYYEADVCNVGDTATLTMVGTAADGVEIPDKFLLDGRNVLVYVVIPGSGGDVQTRYDITMPVDERGEREDIDPSEAEQQQIDSLVAALNSGVGRAETAATEAEGSASNAAGHATDAEAWAAGQRAGTDVGTEDPTYHNNAKYYAGMAEAAAEEAGRHEASWESWVRRAEAAADDAEGSARAAAGSKADAEAAAQKATRQATAAENSATAAAGSAAEARQTVDGGVGAINTARDGALTAIGQAGTTQVNAVNQAGAAQVTAVNQAGTTQVQAVENKGAEVLDSIPQDYSDLVDDVADLTRHLSDVKENQIPELKSILTFEEEQRVNLDEIVNGEAKIQSAPFVKRKGYGSSGYVANTIAAYSQCKLSAGKYRITPPTGFYVNIRYYISDAEGGEVALVNTKSATTITLSDVAVLNIQSTDSHNITDEDIAFLDGSQIVKKQLSTSASLVSQIELLNETDKGIIHLSYLGTGYNSNIDVGLFGFTTSTNKLYYKDANGNVVYDDPYTDQIFLYGKNLYKWSGTNLDLYIILDQLTANSILNVLTNSIIALSYSAASNIVQNLNVGQIGLNTTTGELWYKYRSDASTSLAAKDNEYFYYQGKLYQWTNSALAEVLSIIEMNNAINMLLIPYKNGIVHLKYKTSQSGQSSTLSSGEFGYYEVDNKVYVRIGINSVKSFSPTTGVYEFDGLYYAWDGTKLAVKWNPEDYKTDVLKYTDLTPGYYNLSAISQLFFDPQQRFVAPSDGNPDGYGCTMIPVKKGWSIILTTNGGAGHARAWGWVDIEMMLGDVADASVSTTVTLTAPYDGYLVVNTVANNASKKERFSCIMQIPVKSTVQDLSFVSSMEKKNELLPQYDESNPCNALLQGVGLMGSIHHWGIIGASFDSGEFNYYHGSDVYMCDYYEYAWPSVLQRLYGIPDLYIFGNGGQTSKGWVTSAGTTYVFATDQEEFVAGRTGYSGIGPGGGSWAYAKQHPKQAYVIVLGSNDINHESYDSGDLDRDIGTYDVENDVNIAPDNPTASVYGSTGLVDSYAGYISGIIQRIQSIQPNAKIFVATIRSGFAYNSTQYAKWNRFNSVVNALPDYFNNVYVIDYGKYGPRYWETDFKAKYWTIDHPNATGYQIMAYYYGTLINKAIQDNADEFKGTQWIGYDRPIMT